MVDFLSNNEVAVSFSKAIETAGWESTTASEVQAKAIVSRGGGMLDPKEADETKGIKIRVFLKMEWLSTVAPYTVGDFITVGQESFTITRSDLRGVLPGRFPLRFEGERK